MITYLVLGGFHCQALALAVSGVSGGHWLNMPLWCPPPNNTASAAKTTLCLMCQCTKH